ncbi:dimethylarginine dimethylaminohydrolase family protein [Balneatrix alpica]|uniref:Dimethylarginine dimethylaminohydrolase family protein n=1 Tax=Balneatrix alpica TaxID=75684 RepID=A0ABV5ZGT3_9GAMM|nr:arginine deiminase family protein [Balneatrix alpica]
MFKHCILRQPASSMLQGLSAANLGLPDYALALRQHHDYADALLKTGVDITVLAADEAFPDSCFVEDVALCTPHCAIITRPGAPSRRDEAGLMAPVLARFYPQLEQIEAPGTLEAGDVMMVGQHFYIGLSARTNAEGAAQLIAILQRYGMTGSVVTMAEMLHLKTGLAYLEHNNLLITGEFVHREEFASFNRIIVPAAEAYAANSIWVNDYVIMPAGHPHTRQQVAALGYQVLEVNTSEFQKLDGGVSCLSLRF